MVVRRRSCLTALAAVVALAVGCSGSGDPEPGGATADAVGGRTSHSPSSPAGDADGAVAAYIAMWEDTAVASHTSDVEHPQLDDHATGEALRLLRFVMREHAKKGHVAQGAPKHDVEVVESSPDRRELRDCMDGTDWLMYKRNGELVNNVPGSHGLVDATVERHDHGWVVTDLLMHGAGTC
jgi:hypothetical protein